MPVTTRSRASAEPLELSMDPATFDPSESSTQDINKFIQQQTSAYQDIFDYDLAHTFRDDFKKWKTEDFSRANCLYLVKLRVLLQENGLQIQSIEHPATCISDAAHNDLSMEWNENFLKSLLSHGRNIKSTRIKSKFPYIFAEFKKLGLDCYQQAEDIPIPKSPRNNNSLQIPSYSQVSVPPTYVPGSLSQENPSSPQASAVSPSVHFGDRTVSNSLIQLAKIYSNEAKYSGSDDIFDCQYQIFQDYCTRVGLQVEHYGRALPTMLKGEAQSYYYLNKERWKSQNVNPVVAIKAYFEGPERQRQKMEEWARTSLQNTITNNAGKSIKQCLDAMLEKLRKLFYCLPSEMRNDTYFHHKLIEATRTHPACDWATATPSPTVEGLIQNLRTNVASYEDKQQLRNDTSNAADTFYTDRRYHNHARDRSPYRNRRTQRFRTVRKDQRCYVCHKKGCYSTKHSQEERDEAKQRHHDRMNRQDQYLTECEDGDNLSNDLSDAEDIFDTGFDDAIEGDVSTALFYESFFTSDESEHAKSIASHLSNRVTGHYIGTIPTSGEYCDPIGGSMSAPARVEVAANQNQEMDQMDQMDKTEKIDTAPFTAFVLQDRYSQETFQGILIDSGAANFSTAGYSQYLAFKKIESKVQIDETTAGTANIKFGPGNPLQSIGSVKIDTPVGTVQFHIVDSHTPFLLCLRDLDRLKVYFDNLQNALVGPSPGQKTPVIRRFGHPFLVWDLFYTALLYDSFNANPCFLTDVELRRLHRRFGHPSSTRLHRLLTRAGHDTDVDTIKQIRKFCDQCQRHSKSPGRFRFTLRDDVEFNHSIIVDIMYIDGQPVLHVVDEATRYNAARWIGNVSAQNTWNVLRMIWIDMYLGPPDFIVSDAGKNFTSKEFLQLASGMGIIVKTIPIEAHWSIGIVERYHAVLRRAYEIVEKELPELSKDMALQMSVKAINDTAGPDGLVPTLLVYGAYPRLVEYDPPAPSIAQRAATLRKATAEVRRFHAQRQIHDALNMRNGPSSISVHDLPLQSDVLIWREGKVKQSGRWKGPYKLIGMDRETCRVSLPDGPKDFRSTNVKPYYNSPANDDNNENKTQTPPAPQVMIPPYRPLDTTYNQFDTSRQKEVDGLMERNVFQIINKRDIPPNTRVFNLRFVDEVKNAGTEKAFEKSRLVVQAYNDANKDLVLTESPTIQRCSQRLLLCFAACIDNVDLYLRDVTQAYVQSTTKLNREFYVRPPQELAHRFPPDAILQCVKPLYGIPEAGNHWFKTYHGHHVNKLSMVTSTFDPCLLHCDSPDKGFGIVGMQTDDTLIVGDQVFAQHEEYEINKANILCKARKKLSASTPLKFNGGLISESSQGILLTQERTCKQIRMVKTSNADTVSSRGKIRKDMTPYEQYISQRALGAYVASMSQPEASFDLSFAAQVTNPDESDIKLLNKRLQWQFDNQSRGLRFIHIDMKTARLMVFTDASFAGNKDLSSQIGYVIVLADIDNNANILHWSSTKCKRVTRSVLASELYAMAHAFDAASSIKSTITQLLHMTTPLPLILCTDSKSLYECIVKLGTTQEKRLMIDLMCLRQSFERKEINEVKWIDGTTNPADAMTKSKPCSALQQLINTNKLNINVSKWVDRTSTDATTNEVLHTNSNSQSVKFATPISTTIPN